MNQLDASKLLAGMRQLSVDEGVVARRDLEERTLHRLGVDPETRGHAIGFLEGMEFILSRPGAICEEEREQSGKTEREDTLARLGLRQVR